LVWFRTSKLSISWPTVLAPLLLVPYAWHSRFVNANRYHWQLREGEESRFAFQYLSGNLEGAWKFFFSTSAVQANSLCLVLLGGLGLIWATVRLARTRGRWSFVQGRAVVPATIFFSATIAANLVLLMFYYWSRLDEPTATRFALPLYLVLSIGAGWLIHVLDSRFVSACRFAWVMIVGWMLVFGGTAYAQRLYTSRNLIMHELEWEINQVTERKGSILLITSTAVLPFLLRKIPTLNTNIAPHRAAEIAWHMSEGTFREILVSQVVRPSSSEFHPVIDPESELPANFRLETISMRRFGVRWIRISRLVGVDLPGSVSKTP
jgi:hypothetical protein